MELHRLAFLHHIADRDGARGAVSPEQIPNEKISALEPIPMFIDGDTEMERPMSATLIFLRQGSEEGLQLLQSRRTSKFVNQIAFGSRHYKPVADQPTPL
jgi:hypothetical protein